MTNYAYAVLESQIRIETARIGLDQSTGFLHQTMADRPALILDSLEPRLGVPRSRFRAASGGLKMNNSD